MAPLDHRPLMEMTLDVAFTASKVIGMTPGGLRRITPVTGGSFHGDRLSGEILAGSDWVLNRSDGVMTIDVRLTLRADNAALIYLSYQGRFLAAPAAMARFGKGALLDKNDYSLVVAARFECGDPSYAWLNNVVAVGTGVQLTTGVCYTLYEIGESSRFRH